MLAIARSVCYVIDPAVAAELENTINTLHAMCMEAVPYILARDHLLAKFAIPELYWYESVIVTAARASWFSHAAYTASLTD